MTVKHIQERLHYGLFHNHNYHLFNSYIYNWECDYYSRTKSGNDYEVEIKLSRGDFFKDFKKEKHRIFTAMMEKRSHIVLSGGQFQGDAVCWYQTAHLVNRKISYRYSKTSLEAANTATHADYLDGYHNFRLEWQDRAIRAPYTRIYIREAEKCHTPNCFYYACPDGLIKPEELPPYAGLIWVRDNHAHVMKKAPYMHRRLCDITGTLLQKFYFETVEHRARLRFENK